MILTENQPYIVVDGEAAGTVFLYQFGRKRPFLSMRDFHAIFGENYNLNEISEADARAMLRGPYVPQAERVSFEEALLTSENIDFIREALCRPLDGNGYEIGAGDRPTCVPLGCRVTYVDRFTYEEAKDGSFVGKDEKSFVKVSIYEPMNRLASITEGSASFFIACHVIEHVENVIGSIREVNRKLRPGGHFILVVPDRRHTFDSGRPTTTLEHFVAEDIRQNRECSLEHFLEFARRVEHVDDWITRGIERHQRAGDLHYHCFTPDSMRELLTYMNTEMRFAEAVVFEHARAERVCEFYVRIKKGTA